MSVKDLVMTVWIPVICPDCDSDNVIKHGKSPEGKQRVLST